jgi:hypothetical protein
MSGFLGVWIRLDSPDQVWFRLGLVRRITRGGLWRLRSPQYGT